MISALYERSHRHTMLFPTNTRAGIGFHLRHSVRQVQMESCLEIWNKSLMLTD